MNRAPTLRTAVNGGSPAVVALVVPRRLRRVLAVDRLPGRGARRATACCSATRAPGRSASAPQAPEGTLVQDRRERPPAPGRHPRGDARARAGTSTRRWSTRRELVKDQVIPPGQARRRRLEVRQAAARRAPTWPTRTATAASAGRSSPRAATGSTTTPTTSTSSTSTPASSPAPGSAQARGRPDADPAGLRRRRDQQDRRPEDRARTRASRRRCSSPASTSSTPRRSGSTSSASATTRRP